MPNQKTILTTLFLLAVFLGWAGKSEAGYTSCGTDCYLSDSVSAADVGSAIDAADAASGGTVKIPAGTVTWSTDVSKTLTHNLTISGAGQSATVITGGCSTPFFRLYAPTDVSLKVSDMKLISGAYARTDGMMVVGGLGNSKIVSNMYFDNTGQTTGRALWFYGNGLIYGCTFYMPSHGQGISLRNSLGAGDYNYWYGNPTFGTADSTYIEDNTFNFPNTQGDGAFDAYSGAKLVFRYNSVIGTSVGWHGNDSSTGAHSGEIYKNTFTDPNNQSSFAMNIRGGTGVIWGNAFDSNFPAAFTLSLYRSCDAGGFDPNSICNGSGTRDQNSDATGYRCYQQIGATGTNGVTQWPIIEWDNNYGSGTNNLHFSLNSNFLGQNCKNFGDGAIYDMSYHVKEGQDYINHDTCDGVTSDFCAAWWDDVNKKAKDYTPYTYPHPLRNEEQSDTIPPAAPGGLSVQ